MVQVLWKLNFVFTILFVDYINMHSLTDIRDTFQTLQYPNFQAGGNYTIQYNNLYPGHGPSRFNYFQYYKKAEEINGTIYEDISDDDLSSDSGIASLDLSPSPSIVNWNSDQVMKWILELYDREGFRYEDLSLYYFREKDGRYLISLTEEEWEKIDKKRSKFLYDSVQRLVQESFIRLHEEQTRGSVISYGSSNSVQSSGYHSGNQSSDEEEPRVPYVRRRGRPRSATAKRRNSQRLGRVWEFLRDLLLNRNYCPRIICWEDYPTRVFRLVDGNEVARLWGVKKKNPHMNYGKFSRSIRHYYKMKVIESVSGKRYVYKFGENAEGCETDNPNFGINVNTRT